jgi:hypothetical protein
MLNYFNLQRILPPGSGRVLVRAEQQGYIIVTVRSFGSVKTLTLVSMRLQIISIESVQWVLRGLKRDGMGPNERAI